MDLYLASHVKDLLNNAKRRNEPQYSFFLREEEQEEISPLLSSGSSVSSAFLPEDSERKILFVYPSYLEKEEVLTETNPIVLLRVYPKSEKFASPITHRDVLGALMNLGLKRETIGDIIIHEKETYVYLLSSIVEEVERSLSQIKNNKVVVEKLDSLICPYAISYIEATFQVSSIRLDAILSEVYNLSRDESKSAINDTLVKMSKHSVFKANTEPTINEAISLRGKGKFVYLGEVGKSKKGKSIILVKKPQ